MKIKRPSFQFYPGDWLNDAALRLCSVPARGLWIDMLCLMHQGSEYGYLKVNHKVILPVNLARLVGATLQEIEGWLAELDAAGVYSIDDDGCIFSRRMVKDENTRQLRAAGGIKGGNPELMKDKKDNLKVTTKVNLPPNLKPTPSSSSSSSSSSSNKNTTPLARLESLKVDKQIAKDWLALRNKLKAPVTDTVIKSFLKKAKSCNKTLEQVLLICIDKSWRGFEPQWLEGTNGTEAKTVNRHEIKLPNGTVLDDWRTHDEGIKAKGRELGLKLEKDEDLKLYRKRIFDKLGVSYG